MAFPRAGLSGPFLSLPVLMEAFPQGLDAHDADLSIARGSLMEVETHLELSQRVGLLPKEQLDNLLRLSDEISRMLSGLRTSLLRK